jgi:hypothetical protein
MYFQMDYNCFVNQLYQQSTGQVLNMAAVLWKLGKETTF